MEILSKTQISLRDSLPTQRFIRLIDNLIRAMMSRTPLQALKYSQSEVCPAREVKKNIYFSIDTLTSMILLLRIHGTDKFLHNN